MNKFKLYDTVEFINDYKEDNVLPKNEEIYKKGTTGTIIEIYDDKNVLVEVSYKDYKDYLPTVNTDYLKKI